MYKMMITFIVRPGTMEETFKAIKRCVAPTRLEPACLQYEFYKCFDDENKFIAVECFVDQAGHITHQETPHFKSLLPVLEANVASYNVELVIDPPQPNKA